MQALFKNVLAGRNRRDPRADFLHSNRLFDHLTRKECRQLSALLHERRYEADELVFKEGEVGAAMYLIKAGRVCITRKGRTLVELGEGDFFGESALFSRNARSATILAAEADTVLLVLSKGELEELIISQPVLANKVILRIAEVLAMRLELTNEQMINDANARAQADDGA
jgi:CRP-like cAMP-binding protein